MIAIRAATIAMVVAIALFATLVAFGNLTDSAINFVFVQHVLSMDTIFPGSHIGYRAIASPAPRAAYAIIIAAEAMTALLCWTGALALLRALRADADTFHRAKTRDGGVPAAVLYVCVYCGGGSSDRRKAGLGAAAVRAGHLVFVAENRAGSACDHAQGAG